ncbi:hypothetical protein L1987_12965 [Smallanthus sonchifolius]|uniref:Uncharacterized protein n=1 Tax=Smallanthus sonchifolius TaxID=185202 RepID=A0ACB9JG61_9ASTR|nr:hypothetical protein L1987_12965 [Smallanthus sonchifolius]
MEDVPSSFGVHRWVSSPYLATWVPVLFWKDYFFVYNHRLLYMIGLAFSRSLTNSAIVSVLMWYFTSDEDGVVMPAILTNRESEGKQQGIEGEGQEERNQRNEACWRVGDSLLLCAGSGCWLSNDVIWHLLVTLPLLALGTSGDPLLLDALQDLVNDIDEPAHHNEARSFARATIWLLVAYVFGSLLAILLWVDPNAIGGLDSSWKSSFFICIITMTLAVIISGFGHDQFKEGLVDVFFGYNFFIHSLLAIIYTLLLKLYRDWD